MAVLTEGPMGRKKFSRLKVVPDLRYILMHDGLSLRMNLKVHIKFTCLFAGLFLLSAGSTWSQSAYRTATFTYKTIDTIDLDLQVVYPKKIKKRANIPAVIFFFGGGWFGGTTKQFMPHCQYLAGLGMIGITAEYRVKDMHGTTPQDAISDAKSAIRWLKLHAEELQIDKNRIIAAGGSAGGHLAACTATLPGFNDTRDDLSIDPIPGALILFNPVVVITRFSDRFGGEEKAKAASPIFFISENTPPTLIFHGTDDKTVPAATILEFQKKMIGHGNTCEVILFGDKDHAFFNKGKDNDRPYHQTLALMKQFLVEEGFIAE
jgi:acetyl esterase/lipase